MNTKNITMKKTKIISTMGPTFESPEMIREMISRGVNVVRLNTSHGDYEEHGERIKAVKIIRKEMDQPISLLLDTKGPEIRVGEIKNKKLFVKIGDILKIHCNKEHFVGENNEFWVSYDDLANTVSPGQLIMIDDGKLSLETIKVDAKKGLVTVKVLNNHYVGTKKAVNVPGAKLTLPFISEYDKEVILWGIKQGIDYVAASFVRDGSDVLELRKLLDDNKGKHIQIMSKIEALQAINHINDIVKESDAIMLARGDLGVEIPYQEVPFYEKLLIAKSRAWGKPIVIATQMLDSMTDNPRPTRAEVTDVYYATMSGADGTMLSGESASGNFPKEAVETMALINFEAEKNFDYLAAFEEAYAYVESCNAESAYLVARTALTEDVKYIFAFSTQGRLIKALSRFRSNAVVIALLQDENQIYSFGANYGVYAHHYQNQNDFNDDEKIKLLAKKIGIKNGDKIIIANSKEFRTLRV